MDLMQRLSEYRSEEEKLRWEGSFADYFELVKKTPRIARLGHGRIFDMIMAAGVERRGDHDAPHYHFFEEELFGLEKPLQQLVEYFSSAAQRLEIRKRILLLMGPVGGGKSTIVAMLKRGLEEWTRTEAGAVHAPQDCPMPEGPPHLSPADRRPENAKAYGITTT